MSKITDIPAYYASLLAAKQSPDLSGGLSLAQAKEVCLEQIFREAIEGRIEQEAAIQFLIQQKTGPGLTAEAAEVQIRQRFALPTSSPL